MDCLNHQVFPNATAAMVCLQVDAVEVEAMIYNDLFAAEEIDGDAVAVAAEMVYNDNGISASDHSNNSSQTNCMGMVNKILP